MQALKVLLEGLETQERTAGVTTILVNGLGKPWQPNQFIREITLVSDAIGIFISTRTRGCRARSTSTIFAAHLYYEPYRRNDAHRPGDRTVSSP